MSNSLAAVHPELIVEWSDRNLPLTPDSVTFGSNKKVWWKGTCGHEWETSVKARSNGEKCPICSGARVVTGINDLSTLKPKLASEWSEKNEIKPTEVSIGSHKKVIWQCKLGHEWTAMVENMESGMIDVNHTLVYYDHRTEGSKKGCYFNVNTTKTPASMRQVPMLDFVKEAFELEKQKQKDLDIHCEVTIDGYSDFIFINRFGQAQHQATLNKAIRRIIRDCNDEQFEKSEEPEVLLPHFSCHSLRHTFTTRMCEAGVNIKVIQDALGHTDISTTLNIYTDVTKELKTSEFKGLDNYFKAQ